MDADQAAGADSHSDDEHAVPDVELLQFQKQRSTPKVSISECHLDNYTDTVHAEVEDFGQIEASASLMGMARSGHEEQVIRQLHRAGSIDATALLPDVTATQQEVGEGVAAQQEEEKKV